LAGYNTASPRCDYRFVDVRHFKIKLEDPRLEPDPDWERVALEDIGREITGDDPEVCCFFKHRATGEVIDYDPRMTADALRRRGVPLRTFALV
jgi:hypothetical protein